MNDFKPISYSDSQKKWTNFRGLCKSCGICLEKCPVRALSWSEDLGYYGTPAVDCDIKKCIACGICELYCPDCAIRIEKISNKK